MEYDWLFIGKEGAHFGFVHATELYIFAMCIYVSSHLMHLNKITERSIDFLLLMECLFPVCIALVLSPRPKAELFGSCRADFSSGSP